MRTTINTTQDIINICTQSTYLQKAGNLDCFYVYIHYTTKGIPFYIGQGSHNRAYKYTGRSNKWYEFVGTHTPIIIIIGHSLSFTMSIELEKQLIQQYKDTLINEDYGHSPNESFPVLCFTRNRILVKRYNSCKDTERDGFNSGAVSVNCNINQGRSTYKGFVWCYEKDYETRKESMFKMGLTVAKPIEVTFPNGITKTYLSMSATSEDGLLPAKVRAVLIGERKSHKGCSFRFLD